MFTILGSIALFERQDCSDKYHSFKAFAENGKWVCLIHAAFNSGRIVESCSVFNYHHAEIVNSGFGFERKNLKAGVPSHYLKDAYVFIQDVDGTRFATISLGTH